MTIREMDALAVMVNKPVAAIEIGMRMSANAVFLFQKLDCIFRSGLFLIEGMYPEFSLRKTAAVSAKLIIDVRLRNRKSGKLLCFRFFDMLYLFF